MPTIMNRLWILPLLLALAACATQTPYQPARQGVGYSEQRLESNRFRVSYAGNARTPRSAVENYLLYRSAELTLQHGYDYFVLSDQSTLVETRYQYSLSGWGGFGPYYWYPRAALGVNTAYPETEFQAEALVLMFKGPKPADDRKAFDAREVQANLESSIPRPQVK